VSFVLRRLAAKWELLDPLLSIVTPRYLYASLLIRGWLERRRLEKGERVRFLVKVTRFVFVLEKSRSQVWLQSEM
jgi:hypothetical protein